ncbi:MAG: PKD domain-containing protein [Chitinophagales bacterium]
MKTTLLLLALICATHFSANASHITGAEITVKNVGPELFEVQMIIYRDCTSFTPFDNTSYFSVFNAVTYDYEFNFLVTDPVIEEINMNYTCFDTLDDVCLERAIYTKIITLETSADPYLIVYQRCCWTSEIINIELADDHGMTIFQEVRSDAVEIDNSPVFVTDPPYLTCVNEPLYIDHGATDLDGDSLVYVFYTPFQGAEFGDPAPTIASPPPYDELIYTAGFSVDYPITSDPAFEIDPISGLITGTPTAPGRYLLGIAAEEYRDGLLISKHSRTFTIIVEDCTNYFTAEATAIMGTCGDFEVNFNNLSEGADDYLWVFGDGTFSTDETPVHIYDDFGTYNAMLIAEPGDECADTALITITLAESIYIANGIGTPGICGSMEVVFENLSTGGGDYYWDFGDGTNSTVESPTHIYTDYGSYTVMLIAAPGDPCADTTYLIVDVLNTGIVATIDFDGETLSTASADTYQWYLDGDIIPGATNQTYVPEESGNYYVEITIDGCTDKSDELSVIVEGTGNLEISQIKIYPNPNDGNGFTIISDFINQASELIIVNAEGQIIVNQQVILDHSTKIDIDLLKGIYLIRLTDEFGTHSETMVIF